MSAQQNCIDCSVIDPDAICFLIWAPVCGCDGVTYSNDCVAYYSAGVTYWNEGECPSNNASICSDLEGLDFGECDMVLGIAVVNGECVTVSGCSTIAANGVDYAASFTGDPIFCDENCLCGTANGIEESQSFEVAVIPNPMENEFQLNFHFGHRLDISLVDISGRTAMEAQISSEQKVNVSSLQDGMYILIIKQGPELLSTQRLWKGITKN